MMVIIGVDPGETTGIFVMVVTGAQLGIHTPESSKILSTSAIQYRGVGGGVNAIIEAFAPLENDAAIAYEKFIVGPRSAKSRNSQGGQAARDVIGQIAMVRGAQLFSHTASAAKKWATNQRLAEAGILGATHEMRHARDAARHALFCAVANRWLHDPLSQKAG